MSSLQYGTVVLSCCQHSHPFNERRITVTSEPVKIGRAVAKLRPASDNAIFDCKVLSRNHAVISYEDGKFYLKDTKSSNGTFVNNQRLSKGSEESAPKELFSCDIVQFGVDIMENKKVTHGCIIAMVRLYQANGSEVECRSFDYQPMSNAQPSEIAIETSFQELYQLQQYIKEAAYREQILCAKFATIESLLENAQVASTNSWQALVDEDRLLSRIEALESQLAVCSKNMTDEKLRHELQLLNEEREKLENAAKESLRITFQEKMEMTLRLADVERSLETTEEECARLKTECDFARAELDTLARKHSQAICEIVELSLKIEEAECKSSEAKNNNGTNNLDAVQRQQQHDDDMAENFLLDSAANENGIAPEAIDNVSEECFASSSSIPSTVNHFLPSNEKNSSKTASEIRGDNMPEFGGKLVEEDSHTEVQCSYPPDPCDLTHHQTSRFSSDEHARRWGSHSYVELTQSDTLEKALRREAHDNEAQPEVFREEIGRLYKDNELLKEKLKSVTEELEFERSLRVMSDLDTDNARIILHRQAAKNQVEFATLKDECAILKNRILAIEREMILSRKENSLLSSEYRRLQESYRDLEKLNDGLDNHFAEENSVVSYGATTVACANSDVFATDSNTELVVLRSLRLQQQEEIDRLRRELRNADHSNSNVFEAMDIQNQLTAMCSVIPLLIFFVAVVIAFLPFFSSLTATNDHGADLINL